VRRRGRWQVRDELLGDLFLVPQHEAH
jgi:hypothetical protein